MKKAKLRSRGLDPELLSQFGTQRLPQSVSDQARCRSLVRFSSEYWICRDIVAEPAGGIARCRVRQKGISRAEIGRWMKRGFPDHTKGRNLFHMGNGAKIGGNADGSLRRYATTKMPVAVSGVLSFL